MRNRSAVLMLMSLVMLAGVNSAFAAPVNPFLGCPGNADGNWAAGQTKDLEMMEAAYGQNVPSLDLNADGIVTAQDSVLAKSMRGLCRAQADVNNDGKVNGVDLALVLGAFGTTAPEFDISGDGIVNKTDVKFLKRAWGNIATFHHCDADLNQDGKVGLADVKIIKMIISSGEGEADLNLDSVTDYKDLQFLRGAYGKSCANSWVPSVALN